MHFTAIACFSWCALDALGLYFFHANTFPVIRNTNFYFLTGWGSPIIVIILTMLIGFLDKTRPKTISLYTCWSSDNVIWAFVVSSVVIAMVNILILVIILKQLRHPSYDISPKAAIEKRGTRYGLRTNSLMLLGLCLGWTFTILSFKEGSNLRYQLTFGLINGLQGIFLFFFHCLLNSDHVKGYSSGSRRGLEESGRSPTSDSIRSKRQEFQSGSNKSRSSNRSSKLENVPLISVSNTSKPAEEKSESALDQSQESPRLIKSENIQVIEKDETNRRQPDLDLIPQLPGMPDTNFDHLESFSNKTLQSGDLKGGGRSRRKRPKTAENQLQVCDNKIEVERKRKSSSEPAISSGQFDIIKGSERAARQIPTTLGEYLPYAKDKKKSPRTHTSVNELENLFSGSECFVKPHCSSLTSIPRRERKISSEEKHCKSSSTTDTRQNRNQTTDEESSRTASRNTNETIL
ncbi:Adhesion G-protein coupled receptor D1 [Exaiptasia diaphana]|nr:Adhesion G-protein coupled receptor D1 [Exaiptasia diaphana]